IPYCDGDAPTQVIFFSRNPRGKPASGTNPYISSCGRASFKIWRTDSSRSRCPRTAAEPAQGTVECAQADLEARKHIGEPQAPRVVQVKPGESALADSRAHTHHQFLDLRRVCVSH